MMTTRKWASDSFWESYDQNRITSILTTVDDEGRETKQQLTVSRFDPEGNPNPDFQEILDQVGEEKISENTTARNERKVKERELQHQKKLEREKADKLQRLFEYKIEAFEIDSIKNSKNRALKSKLRKAKNIVEVNIFSMMIVMEEMNNESSAD